MFRGRREVMMDVCRILMFKGRVEVVFIGKIYKEGFELEKNKKGWF